MPRQSVCAEVGVWKGNFSEAILIRVQPRELHLIDPWLFVPQPSYSGAWYGGARATSQDDMDAICKSVKARFEGEIKAGSVIVHRQRSADAAKTFNREYFDWVYIDGDHHYDAVRLDLDHFGTLVKMGGYICGDDYSRGGWWGDDVIRAVDDFVASGRAEVVAFEGKQYVLRRVR
jgi:hypothetical protein